jgi:hypothetical protein
MHPLTACVPDVKLREGAAEDWRTAMAQVNRKSRLRMRSTGGLPMLIGAVLLLTMVIGSSGASAAHLPAGPANCNSSFDPYHYTRAAVSACGYKTFPLLATSKLPGGGTMYEYHMNGKPVKTYRPPAGFRPYSASNAKLAEYGFPPRPTNPSALAVWRTEMRSWRGSAPAPRFLMETHTRADTTYSNIWAGYAIQDLGGNFFTHAEGWYTEPTIYGSRCSHTLEVSWAGIGAYTGSGILAQNGTVYDSSGAYNHQAWWEILPDYPSIVPIPFYGHPGYVFDASTRWLGNNAYRFWFYDYYSHTTDVFDVSDFYYDPVSAEVIIERPQVNNVPTNLSNFGTWSVANAAANGAWFNTYPPSSANSLTIRHGVHMASKTTGNDLADPSNIGSGGYFTVSQHNCN